MFDICVLFSIASYTIRNVYETIDHFLDLENTKVS